METQRVRPTFKHIYFRKWVMFLAGLFVGASAHANPRAVVVDNILQSSNLPIIILQTNGQAILDQPKITARMGVIDNGMGMLNHRNDPFNHFDGYVGIELRGESSLTFVKKSYRLETRDSLGNNRNVSLLGMPKENDWILYGPYVDKTLLRNALMFHLGESTGRYAPRMRFCELVINDQYVGVYALMEKIKQDKNRVSIAAIKPWDLSGVSLTGGYIVRMDKPDSGYVSFNTGLRMPHHSQITLQFYDPPREELNDVQAEWLKQFFYRMEETLIGSNFKSLETGYREYLDAGSFIDFLLTGELALDVDKFKYSTYFFKEKETDGGKLHAGPIWDFDLGFGNDEPWSYGQKGDVWQYLETDIGRCYWWERLMEDLYFRNRCFSRWSFLRTNSFSDAAVTQYIDSCATLLDGPQTRNFQQWVIMGLKLYENTFVGQTYAQEVAYLKSWTLQRLQWMDTNLNGFLLKPEATLQQLPQEMGASTTVVRLSLRDDYFNRKFFQNDDFKLNNEGPYLTKDSVHFVNDSTVDLHLRQAPSPEGLTADLTVTVRAKVLDSSVDLTSKSIRISDLDKIVGRPEFQLLARNQQLLIRTRSGLTGELLLELYDLTGRLALRQRLEMTLETQVPVSLTKGVYLVRLKVGDHTYQERVFIP